MSEYTRQEILKMIEEAEGPQNLDLSGKDLSGIDLSKEAIAQELERIGAAKFRRNPVWQAPSPWGISLEKVKLSKAKLERARLSGAYLFDAHLEGANLDYTHLEEAFLFGARLNKASLFETHLERASIGRAHFDQAYLCWTHLNGVDLSEASLLGTHFEAAYLNQTRIKKEQLGTRIPEEEQRQYRKAGEVYLLLKNNFSQIGRYDDASWAYRKERRMERITHRPDLAPKYYDYPKLPEPLPTGAKGILHRLWLPFRKVGFLFRHLIHYWFDTAQLVLCDFGENPWLVLIWAGAALFLFSLAYMGFGGLGPAPGASSAIALGDHFVYSLFAFATMDHPRIVATTGLAQFLTAFEALVGIFLAAIFVFTLGNRISRS